jgi:hypothetical protein
MRALFRNRAFTPIGATALRTAVDRTSSEPVIDVMIRSQLIRPARRMPANIAQLPISYGEAAQMHRLQFPDALGACRAGQPYP